jgi:hypothetical protein
MYRVLASLDGRAPDYDAWPWMSSRKEVNAERRKEAPLFLISVIILYREWRRKRLNHMSYTRDKPLILLARVTSRMMNLKSVIEEASISTAACLLTLQ